MSFSADEELAELAEGDLRNGMRGPLEGAPMVNFLWPSAGVLAEGGRVSALPECVRDMVGRAPPLGVVRSVMYPSDSPVLSVARRPVRRGVTGQAAARCLSKALPLVGLMSARLGEERAVTVPELGGERGKRYGCLWLLTSTAEAMNGGEGWRAVSLRSVIVARMSCAAGGQGESGGGERSLVNDNDRFG